MKQSTSINYRAFFTNNLVYRDPQGILTREQLYIFVLWLNGLDQLSIATLLNIPIGTIKMRQTEIFSLLRLKLSLQLNIDNRALIEAARDYGILTEENHKLPKEIAVWMVEEKSKRKKALAQ
jgi:DNA-binding NarL/FixJ family response regulator